MNEKAEEEILLFLAFANKYFDPPSPWVFTTLAGELK